MPVDDRMLAFVAEQRWGVLAAVKSDGRPHLSTVGYAYDPVPRLFRVFTRPSVTETRNSRGSGS